MHDSAFRRRFPRLTSLCMSASIVNTSLTKPGRTSGLFPDDRISWPPLMVQIQGFEGGLGQASMMTGSGLAMAGQHRKHFVASYAGSVRGTSRGCTCTCAVYSGNTHGGGGVAMFASEHEQSSRAVKGTATWDGIARLLKLPHLGIASTK